MKATRGYTLLEMMVSVGLFSVVMLIATAAYLTLISVDRQTRATSDLMTNLSYTVDNMSRSIRTGTDYCVASCSQTRFSFIDSEGRQIVYRLSGSTITRQIDGATEVAITDPRISIASDGLRFYVWGEAEGSADNTQPRVLFTVKGSITPDAEEPPVTFIVQGAASQRAIDI